MDFILMITFSISQKYGQEKAELCQSMSAPLANTVLNAKAEPFVPKPISKPDPTLNMAKLGKVKKQRRKPLGASSHVQSDSEDALPKTPIGADKKSAAKPNGVATKSDDVRQHTKRPASDQQQQHTSARPRQSATSKEKPDAVDVSREMNQNLQKRRPRQQQTRASRHADSPHNKETENNPGILSEQRPNFVKETKKGPSKRPEDRKSKARRDQYAYLHSFAEKKPVNAVNVETQRGRNVFQN